MRYINTLTFTFYLFPIPSLIPSLGLIHTSLSKKRGGAASTLNAHHQASLMVSRYTTLVPPLRSCIGPARVRQASSLVREGGTCHLVKKERRLRLKPSVADWGDGVSAGCTASPIVR